jgi:hypothetical protein
MEEKQQEVSGRQDLTKIQQTAEKILFEIHKGNSTNKQQMAKSFFMGVFYALGATIGFAILTAILTFVVKLLGGLPVIGNWFVHFGKYLHQ